MALLVHQLKSMSQETDDNNIITICMLYLSRERGMVRVGRRIIDHVVFAGGGGNRLSSSIRSSWRNVVCVLCTESEQRSNMDAYIGIRRIDGNTSLSRSFVRGRVRVPITTIRSRSIGVAMVPSSSKTSLPRTHNFIS